MNQINENIDPAEIASKCRELELRQLMSLLKQDINMFWSWGAHAFTITYKTL